MENISENPENPENPKNSQNSQNSPKKNPSEERPNRMNPPPSFTKPSPINRNLREDRHVRMNPPPTNSNFLNTNNYRQFKRGANQMQFIHQINKNPISNEEIRSKLNNKYTIEEVGKHNTTEDCWMVFNNIVYDVTEYLNFHPGGKSILMTCAGKDGTSMFYKAHPWVDINSLLKNYIIGSLSK